MIDRTALLADLKPLVAALEDDLRTHAGADAAVGARLIHEHERASEAHRTAMAFADWRDGEITQAAVAWVLACVFVRFLEDNELIDQPLLSGPGGRRDAASGRRQVFFEQYPQLSDREYLRWCFDQVSAFPAVAPLYDLRHVPIERLPLSVDGAAMLREFWTLSDPETGDLRHDFTDPGFGTRFLGDLYQDLSETAKKRYALLQTPDFIESFILDRTLEPAIAEFGLEEVRLIDPTCGSGHFLISAFDRLLDRWRGREPATNAAVLAQRALDQVYGVDLNPFATAIARFRLITEALRRCGVHRLAEAPAFRVHLATGDSLLHGSEPSQQRLAGMGRYREGIAHVYDTEDADELARILGQGYHAVVGNPPYITVKDPALRAAYRERYASCHREYALSVPFMERFFELALLDDGRAGYVGKITANSFMKREFGKPLVESFLPSRDVTALVDTSGAYIPGHGTPTVLVLGRARPPVADTIRVVDSIRGEPTQPIDPASGKVWCSIVSSVDSPGTSTAFVRTTDTSRREFSAHPLSLGIGRSLRLGLESLSTRVGKVARELGFAAISGDDDFYLVDTKQDIRRSGAERATDVILGTDVRDWHATRVAGYWPHDADFSPRLDDCDRRLYWPFRRALIERRRFGIPILEAGLRWFEWREIYPSKLRTPLTITWGEVATHNHFVLDRGGTVFKQTAPVIKLHESASEEDHLRLLGVLNSSTACFWLMQVCQPKGAHLAQSRTREERYAFNASNVEELPLPAPERRGLSLPKAIDALACERAKLLDHLPTELHAHVARARQRDAEIRAKMISLQEELDWEALGAYDLVDDELHVGADAPPLRLGERAFEIVLARQEAASEVETAWFERHGATRTTEVPKHWPPEYRALVEQRIQLIEDDPDIGLIERPEHKRRWNGTKPFDERLQERLRGLVLDRLEEPDLWGGEPALKTVSDLADVVRRTPQLVEACQILAGSRDVDPGDVVRDLVLGDAVPFLAAYRYTDSGLRKRATWEQVWDLQRAEDRGEEVGPIPVPPRYAKADFRPGPAWGLRGKLDVPKERFILVPGAGLGAGGSAVVGWAGWDEARRVQALAARIGDLREKEAADVERLTPLLAGVLELLPWVHQWHPEIVPDYGQTLGDAFEAWLDEQLSAAGTTRDNLRAWRAPAPTRGRKRAAASA